MWRQAAGAGGGGVLSSQLPPDAPPGLPTTCGLWPAGPTRLAAPRRAARVGLGARRVAEAAGPNARGSERGRGRSRSPEPGARSRAARRGAGGKWASCSARTAVSPAAPPAAPLTFHLQEKLPSGRRRRFPVPGSRTRWARLLAACGKGRPSPRVAASRGLISLTESRVYTGRME